MNAQTLHWDYLVSDRKCRSTVTKCYLSFKQNEGLRFSYIKRCSPGVNQCCLSFQQKEYPPVQQRLILKYLISYRERRSSYSKCFFSFQQNEYSVVQRSTPLVNSKYAHYLVDTGTNMPAWMASCKETLLASWEWILPSVNTCSKESNPHLLVVQQTVKPQLN